MTRTLLERLGLVYDETLAARVMALRARWPVGSFGDVIGDVRTIVPHLTGGWPARSKAEGFVRRYTVAGTAGRGIGPQFNVSGDGTATRLIDLPLLTWHAEFINTWSFGIEQGNLGNGRPKSDPASWNWPPHNPNWRQLNQDAATQAADDIPGARAWIRPFSHPHEVAVAWWTTGTYAGPWRAPSAVTWMLFSEWDYRTMALLCRYLSEEWNVPRSVPLLPHTLRQNVLQNNSEPFRRIVLADPAFADFVTAMSTYGMTAPEFDVVHGIQADYAAAHANAAPAQERKELNRAWVRLFDVYRGFHGHGFSGAIVDPATESPHSDHDCPGPLFNWHRFAREISDYWWMPFDVDAAGSTATPRRAYQYPDGTTPVHEYYFDEQEVTRLVRARHGIHGPTSSPATFQMDDQSPVYAMANGELIAARIPPPDAAHVSTAFALIRHEVFHQQDVLAMLPWAVHIPRPGQIDYTREPSYVYTLYMHLGRSGGVDLNGISDQNPDWLNRTLARKKECELGLAYYAHATHHGIADVKWNTAPPGSAPRASLREGWAIDDVELGRFLTALRSGDIALAPPRDSRHRPIRILLGDYLGRAGICDLSGGNAIHGVRIEAFAQEPLPGFTTSSTSPDWSPPVGLPGPHALLYQSEWARIPTGLEAIRVTAAGYDVNTPLWWPAVVMTSAMREPTLPATARLPTDGRVWHYHPFDLARWLNDLTWKHERGKYQSAAVNALVKPRSRRV